MEIACPEISIQQLIELMNKNTGLNDSNIHNPENLFFGDSRFPYRDRMMRFVE